MSGRRVVVAGATGLVGRAVVRQLLDHPDVPEVVALVRRPGSAGVHPRLQEVVVDWERLAAHAADLAGHVAICALGTTMRQAGSRAAFRRVDHDYVLAFARAAREAGARHFLLVSSAGADPRSPVLYSRTKGEVERAIRAMAWPVLTIVRPSLLLGDRAEVRPGERLMAPLARLAPRRWRAVPATRVAAALVGEALGRETGERVLENPALLAAEPAGPAGGFRGDQTGGDG